MGKINHNRDYTSIVEVARLFTSTSNPVVLTGESLSIQEILSVVQGSKISITEDSQVKERMERSYNAMIHDIKTGQPVYGLNSAFGGQAGRVLNSGTETNRIEKGRKLSNGLVFLDITVGPALSKELIRAAIIIRTNMLLKGVSAIRYNTLQHFTDLLNHKITPIVNAYGKIK